MKKTKLLRIAAILLVMLQILTVIVLPTSAASNSYTDAKTGGIKKATNEIVLDGSNTGGEWDNADSYGGFTAYQGTAQDGYSASFKLMWYGSGANAYLYVLLTVNDSTQMNEAGQWAADAFAVAIKEDPNGGSVFATNTQVTVCGTKKTYNTNLSYIATRSNNVYTVEMCYKFSDANNSNGSILFDISVQDNYSPNEFSTSYYTRYSWAGGNVTNTFGGITNPGGTFTLISSDITTLSGAGMRIAEDMSASGLRFETHIDKAEYDALIASGANVKTGTLIVPTDYLVGTEFTKEALRAAGKAYLDIENDGWKQTTASEYVYFGSITNIKEKNHSRAFSGIGYMQIEQGGNTETVYANYSESDHSRAVKGVAYAAYTDGGISYTSENRDILAKYALGSESDYRVMQFNVLHQKEGWGAEDYLNTPIETRGENIIRAIREWSPDVIAFCERHDEWAGKTVDYCDGSVDLVQELSDYTFVQDIIEGNVVNRTPIAYKTNKFNCLASGYKILTEESTLTFATSQNKRVVTYAILQDKETNEKLAVFATHWSSNELYQSTRVTQSNETQAYIQQIVSGEYANLPTIVMADFNSTITNEAYTGLLTNGGLTDADQSIHGTAVNTGLVDHIALKSCEAKSFITFTADYTERASDHKPIICDVKTNK